MSGATCAIFIMSFAPAADTSPCSAAKFRYARITRRDLSVALIKGNAPVARGGAGRETGAAWILA